MPRLRRHPAAIAHLHAALDPLQAQALGLGLDRVAALRLRLLAEELFMNCVLHGCGRLPHGRVALGLRPGGGVLQLRVIDNGPPWVAARGTAAGLGGERAGGQGLRLIDAMTVRLVRRRFAGCNVAQLMLPLGDAPCATTSP